MEMGASVPSAGRPPFRRIFYGDEMERGLIEHTHVSIFMI